MTVGELIGSRWQVLGRWSICLVFAACVGSTAISTRIQADAPVPLAEILARYESAKPGSDEAAAASERLQKALDTGAQATAALLRVVADTRASASELAQSAQTYHAVLEALAGMMLDDPAEQSTVLQARASMVEGRFSDADAQLRQLEARMQAHENPGSSSNLSAANIEVLLGKLALIQLKYQGAEAHFETARRQVATLPAQTHAAEVPPPPLPQLDLDWSQRIDWSSPPSPPAMAAPGPLFEHPDRTDMLRNADGASPGTAQSSPASEAGAQETGPDAEHVGNAREPGSLPVLSSESARATPDPPAIPEHVGDAGEGPAVAVADVKRLLDRGDAMLALGDIVGARLFYERAAALGNARAATSLAKTYDSGFLTTIHAIGTAADPTLAASWYRKAARLSDQESARGPTK